MLIAFGWFSILLLVALWSLTAWGLHALAVWTVSNAGGLTGAAAALQLPAWLALWVPPELVQAVTATWAALWPVVEGLLQAMPMLAGALTVVAWVLWALGTLGLLALGAGLHVLVVLWRRHDPTRTPRGLALPAA